MPYHPPFPLPPEVTRVILGGESSIDLEQLRITGQEAARDFALNYGYDMEIPYQRNHVVRVYEDALAFMKDVILDGTGVDIPKSFRELVDPLDLLVWASEPMAPGGERSEAASWSCALLRVMHTLFHIDHNLILRFLKEIQAQVFERYDRFLVRNPDGSWVLRGGWEVPLAGVERKENKDRNSILLKMLHKPENVAETIYDQIGIRLVAEDQLGVLLIIRFLLDHHVLMATHIKPSRSRNLMFDMAQLDGWMAELPPVYQIQDLSPEARAEICRRIKVRSPSSEVNPFTNKEYSAVQFTARTLVRLPSPAVTALQRVQDYFARTGTPEMGDRLHIPELIQEQEEFTFFFAHEVQVMEQAGFRNAQSGPASHAEYKQRQKEAARRRVLRGILRETPTC
jgi:uncharacterized protein (TIGR04562 family)